ncbi:uncharacterized protein DNG_10073 [Cephalotrichum gorgonifer]|uniref:Uncharacterized protein n=1 Tax=Cephalotrichum gorgonifer TaxID=2041049 RepID=A0AAE8SZW0_9PEZI|nr:uncharacterized protein DNG_10073 [Cephalotrichum gorgonifer]
MAGSGGDESYGSTNPLMLAIRRRVIAAIKQEVESGKEANPYPAFEEEDAEGIDESEIDWDWDEEGCVYDPTLVSPEDTEWQGDFACLDLNMETNQAYISGSASHTDHGRVSINRGSGNK